MPARRLTALSFTRAARGWLTASRRPRLLHVFDRACNLVNERREVLSVVGQQIGNGPFNLVVEEDVCFCNHLDLQSPISISTGQLTLGNLTITTSNTKLWSPRPDWEELHRIKKNILDQVIKLPITNYQVRGLDTGFTKNAQPHSTTTFNSKLPVTNNRSPNSLASSLSSALANADIPSALRITRRLAGLGIGLTPAGDDFILGAVLAAWILHPPEIAGVLAEEITEAAAPLTTSLSAAWLRSAGRGEAGILWHDFFAALVSVSRSGTPTYNDTKTVHESVDRLLAIGHTSGADALAGFIGPLTSSNEIEPEPCPS